MDEKTKAAFENIRFYKFYPVPTSDTPDLSAVKASVVFYRLCISLSSLKYSKVIN